MFTRDCRDPCGVKTDGRRRRIVTIGSGIATALRFPASPIRRRQGRDRRLQQGRGARPRTARHHVNVLQPGSIDTDMNPKDGGAFAEAQRTQHALQRYGTAEEIAAAFCSSQPRRVVCDRHGTECRWRFGA